MTQWFQPLEKKSGPNAGKFHMTIQTNSEASKGIAHPIGYCAEDCPGHDTPGEAIDHWYEYLADKAEFRTVKREDADKLDRCDAAECSEFTANYAFAPGHITMSKHLCDEHLNRDAYLAALRAGRVKS